MPTEYANSAACRAAGVEPVPQVKDEFSYPIMRTRMTDSIAGFSLDEKWPVVGASGTLYSWEGIRSCARLIKRGDVTIPEHSDTKEDDDADA